MLTLNPCKEVTKNIYFMITNFLLLVDDLYLAYNPHEYVTTKNQGGHYNLYG